MCVIHGGLSSGRVTGEITRLSGHLRWFRLLNLSLEMTAPFGFVSRTLLHSLGHLMYARSVTGMKSGLKENSLLNFQSLIIV